MEQTLNLKPEPKPGAHLRKCMDDVLQTHLVLIASRWIFQLKALKVNKPCVLQAEAQGLPALSTSVVNPFLLGADAQEDNNECSARVSTFSISRVTAAAVKKPSSCAQVQVSLAEMWKQPPPLAAPSATSALPAALTLSLSSVDVTLGFDILTSDDKDRLPTTACNWKRTAFANGSSVPSQEQESSPRQCQCPALGTTALIPLMALSSKNRCRQMTLESAVTASPRTRQERNRV